MKQYLKFSYWVLMLAMIVSFVACTEDTGPQPLESNSNAPGMVQNISIDNLAGKAKLTYTLPNDKDLLYVVARYTLENGTPMEVKSSYYRNSMLLEGFRGSDDGSEVEVKVYAVNRSETESSPVTINVQPSKAAIFDVEASLEIVPAFGGINIKGQNPNEENISVLVMQRNDFGDWEPLATSIYTSAAEIDRSLRGFDAEPQDFRFVVRDRWGNEVVRQVLDENNQLTDVITITPFFEQKMPTSAYAGIALSNDAPTTYPIRNLWDGELLEWWGSYFTTREQDIGMSHIVTFDIGQMTKLSRLHIWMFSEPIGGQRLYYYLSAPKKFRLYGSNQIADVNLDTGWTLLGEFEIIKPSGLPYGQENNDDLVAAKDGADYDIPLEIEPVRYIRFVCDENWVGSPSMGVSEIYVYGNPDF